MWITKTSINQPVFATMMMVALCVLGLFSYNRLRVERMPDITVPFVFIQIQYPGASPEAVENDLNKPVEEVVNTVNGVKGRGGSIDGPGAIVANGMVFVTSGYVRQSEMQGNVLLAFSAEE